MKNDTENRGTGEDQRYYVPCPKRKNQARIPLTLCFRCEFVTGEIADPQIEIGCGFPVSSKPKIKKAKPKVKRIERDGLS